MTATSFQRGDRVRSLRWLTCGQIVRVLTEERDEPTYAVRWDGCSFVDEMRRDQIAPLTPMTD